MHSTHISESRHISDNRFSRFGGSVGRSSKKRENALSFASILFFCEIKSFCTHTSYCGCYSKNNQQGFRVATPAYQLTHTDSSERIVSLYHSSFIQIVAMRDLKYVGMHLVEAVTPLTS